MANRSPRNTIEGDSEAETDVLPEATTTPTTKSDAPRRSSVAESGETAEYERGRGRRASEGGERKRPRGIDADADADDSDSRGRGVANERKTRGRPPKRRAQGADQEDDSSDLSSVPSPSSRAGSPSSYLVHPHHPHHHNRHHRRRAKQHNGRLRKRKLLGSGVGSDVVAPGVVADSSGFDAENSDDDTRHGRPRRRKRRRSLPPDSSPPPRLVIKSSPQVSPHPLSPLKSNTRTTEKAHVGQRTLKQRKLPPPPLNTSREKNSSDEALSSSPSFRDRSPSSSSRHPRRHQSTVRTPGSPVSMSHKPRRDTAGRTHLHRACQRGAVSDVETILSLGKEFLNEEDNAGYMPLHEACLHGHLDVVKVLLSHGACLDVPSRIELDTPLLDAVDNGHADVVKYLLELGADPRKRNKQGQTALDANDSNRDFPEKFREIEDLLKVAINKLRSKRSSDDENPRASAPADSHSSRDPSVASPVHQSPHPTPLPTATRRRNARTEQSRKDLLWLDAGKNGLQKLRELAREGDQQLVHALLERGTKPDAESLIGAIKGGHTDTVSLLLAYNNAIVDPDPGNYSRDGNRRNRDTSTPVGEETPMLAAIGRGNLEVLRYLLENGVNPRRLDYRGKSYAEIAKEREGEFWPEEVDMLKKAWDKAGCGGAVKARNPSFSHKGSSPKPKKSITTEGKPAPSNPRRPSSNPSASLPNQSTNPPRHSSPVNTSKYDNTTALSDRESTTAEPLGPPRPQRNAKRTESEISPPVVKKKRRLVSGKDLEEESLAKSHDQSKAVSSTTEGRDTDAKSASGRPADRSARRRPGIGDLKPEPRPSVGATPTGRGAPKPRSDRNDPSQSKPESSVRDKKPVLPKRERTRSPASRSEESRKSELEENKRGRRLLNRVEDPPPPLHKKKTENDNPAMRSKEGVSTKNPNVKRKMHPNETAARRDTDSQARRLSRDEAPPDRTLLHRQDERARRNKTKDTADARRGKERPDRGGAGLERRVKPKDEVDKRRASADLEAKERKRQNHLIKEMMSIQNKAQEESQAAQTDEVFTRELELRKQHEAERVKREAKEREEKEAREKEEEERIAREAHEKEAREAKEREIREREAREREAEEMRLAEIERKEEEEKKRLEEERRREEARILEEQRQEAERKRQELLEQQRLEEIERKRKAAEEEERKRQEIEKAQREKEARDREIAEELQRRLEEEERKRQEEEAAEKRRKEEEEEEARRREIARKEALPYALRQAEEEPGVTSDRSKFLPLYSATFSSASTQSSPTMTTPVKPNPGNSVVQVNGVGPIKSYKWILNVQAALVLGVTDLSFSTCKS